DLAHQFAGLAELSRATRADFFQGKHGAASPIGESAIRSILLHFSHSGNRVLVERLVLSGVGSLPSKAQVSMPLAGKVFVLTGVLPNTTRAQAIQKIRAAGGSVSSNVTRKTDWLVVGESAGAKIGAARELGV